MNHLPPASRTLKRLLLLACALLPGMTPAAAQPEQPVRVVEVIWGFDRRVVPCEFQPLSILLDNLSDEAVEGVVRLRSVSGMIRDTGGMAVQDVFIGPN